MSTKIKIENESDCYSFQCTSEVILKTEFIKVEGSKYNEYEENVESKEIKLELDNVQPGMLSFI